MIILLPFVVALLVAASATFSAPTLVAEARVAEASRPLVVRWVERSRRFRRTGAWVGFVLCVAGVVVLDAESTDGGSGQVSLVLLAAVALGGSVAGSVLAEAFRARRPRGPRVASLEPRDPADYRDRVADRRELVVLGVGALGVVLALALGEGRLAATGWLVLALALAGLRRLVTTRIAQRPRPAADATIVAADETVRRLAASAGFGRPVVTLLALVVSAQWGVLTQATGWAGLVQLALLLAALAWWWGNRRFGLARQVPVPAHRLLGRGALRLAVAVAVLAVPFGILFVLRST